MRLSDLQISLTYSTYRVLNDPHSSIFLMHLTMKSDIFILMRKGKKALLLLKSLFRHSIQGGVPMHGSRPHLCMTREVKKSGRLRLFATCQRSGKMKNYQALPSSDLIWVLLERVQYRIISLMDSQILERPLLRVF